MQLMKSLVARSSAGVFVLVCVATVSAQSLADLARREEERRKTITTSSKVYSNQTLPPEATRVGSVADAPPLPSPSPPPSLPEPVPEPSTSPSGGATADDPTAAGSAEAPDGAAPTEADWGQRISDAREAGSRARILADALQSRINVLAADFVNRDDPAQRSVVAADRDKALAELARVTEEIEQHQQMVIAIQEEARRAGVPAGWVR
jgi:hypothetical protein